VGCSWEGFSHVVRCLIDDDTFMNRGSRIEGESRYYLRILYFFPFNLYSYKLPE
jgi:hypothetical protein